MHLSHGCILLSAAAMTRSSEIQLYLPGVLNAFRHWHRDYAVDIQAPNLLRLMQACSRSSMAHTDFKQDVFQQLWGKGFSMNKHFAAVCYESDFQKTSPKHLYLASPINLESGLTSLTVAPHVIADIDDSEWSAICGALNDYFVEQQWHFEYSSTGRLYVICPDGSVPEDLDQVGDILGQNLLDVMDTEGAINWHATLNEIQMLLFSLPFNQNREANRQLMVNGLWIWGGGVSCLDQTEEAFDYVIGSGDEAKSIAHHARADLLTVYPDPIPHGKGIIIADDCQSFYQSADIDAWQEAMTVLDATLFATLVKQADTISMIHSCDGYQWQPQKKSILHFFQKKRSKLIDFLVGES